MDDERENERMKKTTNELASLVSPLNIGSEEMPIEEYVRLAWEVIVDAKCNMAKLMDLPWGRGVHLGIDLNEEPNEGNVVDDQPTLLVRLSRHVSCPITIKLCNGAFFNLQL